MIHPDKRSCIVYYSLADTIRELNFTKEQIADLFCAILSTGSDMALPELDEKTKTAFSFVRFGLEENARKWDETRHKRAEAGRKGGYKKAENERLRKAAELANLANLAVNDNDNVNANVNVNANANVNANVNVNVNDNGNVNDIANGTIFAAQNAATHTHAFSPSSQANPSPNAAEAHFEALWALYPVKRGKDRVSTETKQALLAVSEREMQQAIDRYIAEVKASASDRQWLNGSTWFEGRYRDYIGDDYSPTPRFAGTVQASARSRATTYRAPGEQFDWSSREE